MSHRLLIKNGSSEREMLLIGVIDVGRDPRCDISDANPLLSRKHAEFLPSDRGVVVRDLNSRNGILVNGRKVLEAVLRPGDVVQIAHLAVTLLSSTDVLADTLPTPVSFQRGSAVAVAGPATAPARDVALEETESGETAASEDDTSVMSPQEIESVGCRDIGPRRRTARVAARQRSEEERCVVRFGRTGRRPDAQRDVIAGSPWGRAGRGREPDRHSRGGRLAVGATC